MGDRSPVLQWERRGGLKRSGGLEWAGAIAGLEQGLSRGAMAQKQCPVLIDKRLAKSSVQAASLREIE
mgnify:CR=1 FL=1